MSGSTAPKLLPRGVWFADYLVTGRPVLHAIDSHGNCIRRVRLSEDASESIARAWLEGLLEHYDALPSPPHLRLVKPEPSMARPAFLAIARPRQARLR